MPMSKVNGANIYYELHGVGHPLVLIAGYTCDHTLWQPVLEKLSQQYQVLVFDNRAVGQTKDDGIPLTVDLMAEDTVKLCEHLQLDRPYIVGHSMGGSIAATIAALYSDKISKLGMLTSAVKLSDRILFAFETMLKMREDNINIEDIIDVSLPWVYGEAFIRDPKNREIIREAVISNPFPQSIQDQARQLQLLKYFDGRDQLKRIEAPTLIICGTQDMIAPVSESAWMAEQIERCQLIELDCAHGVTLEVNDKLTKALMSFF